jgi:hypothetical protein
MDVVIDLFLLRCVAATLLWARHHVSELTVAEARRVDVAVNHLVAMRPALSGEFASTAEVLLSSEPDHRGVRTTAAIDHLAELTHVNLDNAAALAASLAPPSTVTARTQQPELFEDNVDAAAEI